MIGKLIVFSFVCLVASLCSATICVPAKADVQSADAFLGMVVDVIKEMKSIGDDKEAFDAKDPKKVSIPEYIAFLKTEVDDIDCVKSKVKPFQKAKNKKISASAVELSTALTKLVQVRNNHIQSIKKMMNGTTSKMPAGDQAEKAADDQRAIVKSWESFDIAVAKSNNALIDPKDGTALLVTEEALKKAEAELDAIKPRTEGDPTHPEGLAQIVSKSLKAGWNTKRNGN